MARPRDADRQRPDSSSTASARSTGPIRHSPPRPVSNTATRGSGDCSTRHHRSRERAAAALRTTQPRRAVQDPSQPGAAVPQPLTLQGQHGLQSIHHRYRVRPGCFLRASLPCSRKSAGASTGSCGDASPTRHGPRSRSSPADACLPGSRSRSPGACTSGIPNRLA